MTEPHPFGAYLRKKRQIARMPLREVSGLIAEKSDLTLHYVHLAAVERGEENPLTEQYFPILEDVIPGVEASELHRLAAESRPLKIDWSAQGPVHRELQAALARRVDSGLTEERARVLLDALKDD